jgi:hypothetical protein
MANTKGGKSWLEKNFKSLKNPYRIPHLSIVMKIILSLVVGVGLSTYGWAAETGSTFDLQGYVDQQIKAGNHRIVIPPGRYQVTPRGDSHLYFRGLTNLDILADGVEMVCMQTRHALVFDHCSDVHLKGLVIDYDPLPMTEGHIVALAPDKSWLEFQIFDGYPTNDLVDRIEIYDPATSELRRSSYYGWEPFEEMGPGHYRISKGKNYKYNADDDTERVGDIFVTNHDHPAHTEEHAVELGDCTAVKLEDVTVYASPCFGFFEHGCRSDIYQHCVIDRRSPEDDPVKRGYKRMRSLNADAYHSTEAIIGPAIINCVAKYMGDDAVNIHGHYSMIMACTGTSLRVAAPDGLSIHSGDVVEFLPFQGKRPPDAKVKSIQPDAPLTGLEKSFVEKLGLNVHIKSSLLSGEAKLFRLDLDQPVVLPEGSLITATDRVGNGFTVEGCDFGYNRSRGILIKASHGKVINNTISHGWMAAVLISPEFWWLESGSSSDLLISNNIIAGCRQPAIQIVAPGGDGKPLAAGAHRDIIIVNNSITGSPSPNIQAASCAGLVIQGNQLTLPAASGSTGEKRPPIEVKQCSEDNIQPMP